jgi:inosine-uridine nucleoside N-ribohydrolase
MTMRHKSTTTICLLAVLLLICMSLRAADKMRPIPIVLDTDIGSDIDDAFALALVLDSPELDLRAVTTVSGDTQARARIAGKMLWEAGRKDVPVAAGEPGAKLDISQARWADGFTGPSMLSEKAVDLLKQEIDRGDGEIVVVAIGPLTNVAALLQRYPAAKKKIRQIVLMGGSIAHGYYPGSGPTAEYNIAADVNASQIVFSSGIPILMAPLDVTAGLQVDAPNRERVFSRSNLLIDALHQLYIAWGQPTPTLHDPMAVSMLIDPRLCTTRPLAIQIDDHGMTRAVDGKTSNAVVAVETTPSKFIDFYMARIAR